MLKGTQNARSSSNISRKSIGATDEKAKKVTTNALKTSTSIAVSDCKSIASNISGDQSKIPKSKIAAPKVSARNITSPKGLKAPAEDKKFSIKRSSKTMLNIKPEVKKEILPKKPHSARPSNTKLQPPSSRPSTTSSVGLRSNDKYQIGKVPNYLKRHPNKADSAIHSSEKVRAFNTLKNKLRDLQTDFFKTLGNIKENLSDGAQEEYKFVAMVKNGEGKFIIHENKDIPKIEGGLDNKNVVGIKEKLKTMVDDVHLVAHEFISTNKALQANSLEECGDVTKIKKELKDLQTRFEGLTTINQNRAKEVVHILEEMTNSSNAVIKEIDTQELENRVQTLTENLENAKRKLEITESKLSEFKFKEHVRTKENDLETKTKQKLFDEKEKEINKMKNELKVIEEQKQKAFTEVSKQKLKVKKIELELEECKERFERNVQVADEINVLKTDYKQTELRKNELEKLYREEKQFNTKLRSEIQDKDDELCKSRTELEECRLSLGLGEGDSLNKEAELMQEIRMLKFEKDDLIEERNKLEREKKLILRELQNSNEDVQNKFNDAISQLKSLESANDSMKSQMTELEDALEQKTNTIEELENKMIALESSTNSKELQNELTQLRESDKAKKREMHSLKLELSKAKHDLKQREEEILLHQRVLKVRSELINSMQDKEKSNESRVADLYTEIGKQTGYINQINYELAAKAEELQNLFSTLGTKQLELTRQEHIIKMLQESNERNQELQKSQADRIEQLETDLTKLRDSVQVYEKHLLGINENNRHYLFNEHNKLHGKGGASEQQAVYDSERRRKRKIDVNLKK